MKEIEVKILDINRREVETKLLSMGAEKVFDGEMHAVYFDTKDGSMHHNGNLLRLRQEGSKAVIAFKEHVDDETAKVRREIEVEVSDFDTMNDILQSLGFVPWLTMRKHRITYEIDNVHFEFDKYHDDYAYIPEFLEIEARDMASLERFVTILGFAWTNCRPWTILDVARHYSESSSE